MKVFQIFDGFCHWDATLQHPTLQSTEGQYAQDIIFAEAPDYVFEGWGYDAAAEGDARFIQPTPPEGWLYDPETGTFYRESEPEPDPEPEPTEPVPTLEDLKAENKLLRAQVGVLQEQQTFLEDCLLEMADEVYA